MQVLLHGCNGRMGRVMSRILSETPGMTVASGVDITPDAFTNSYPVYARLDDVREAVDAVIDFSHPSSLPGLITYATRHRLPLVLCTTGYSAEERLSISEASSNLAILQSYNMSLGISLMLSLAKQAALLLENDQFDIEIIERHHNQKKDSPSGTAILIAEAINGALSNKMQLMYGRHGASTKRKPQEIGIHSMRGGAIVGEHEVVFAGQGETIEIKHSALSREVFAYGAIAAARFVAGRRPGLYTMADVVAPVLEAAAGSG